MPKAGFEIESSVGTIQSHCVVLATGGRSLPKTGSDGLGYEIAQALGHTIIPTTPALAPLILDGAFHAPLSGLTHPVELTITAATEKPVRLAGSMLWTHFGISGPVPMNASRYWHRARLEGKPVALYANLLPGNDLQSAERRLLEIAAAQPKSQLHNALGLLIPARLADAILSGLNIRPHVQMSQLAREDRRKLLASLLAWPLPVRTSRGYEFAEATAGGVPLEEMDSATMQSRKCPGLYLVGEILDVDGRIGGFNFQWAWSTAFVAACSLASRADSARRTATA